jgi:hypothetical protein
LRADYKKMLGAMREADSSSFQSSRRQQMRDVSTRTAILLAAAAALITTTAHAADKPNILVIIGDDIGWFNPSCYNSGIMGYRTPNIDRIAAEGRGLPTGTASSPAPPVAPRSSPGSRPSAPA